MGKAHDFDHAIVGDAIDDQMSRSDNALPGGKEPAGKTERVDANSGHAFDIPSAWRIWIIADNLAGSQN